MAKTQKHNPWLPIIGAGKLAKATILFAAAYALRNLRQSDDVRQRLEGWAAAIHVDPDGTHLHKLIERAVSIPQNHMHFAAIALFVYGLLFTVEGVGLVLRRRWGEYVTVVLTTLYVPLEVYELFYPGHRVGKALVLAANLAILTYLVWNLYVTREPDDSGTGHPTTAMTDPAGV